MVKVVEKPVTAMAMLKTVLANAVARLSLMNAAFVAVMALLMAPVIVMAMLMRVAAAVKLDRRVAITHVALH